MRSATYVAIAGLLAAGLSFAYWNIYRNSEHTIMLRACEDVLTERLRSPATYRLIEASQIVRSVAEEDDFFYAGDQEEKRRQIRERNRDHAKRDAHEAVIKEFRANEPDRLTLTIAYDASNGFGVPIRSTAVCVTFKPTGQRLSRTETLRIRVDG